MEIRPADARDIGPWMVLVEKVRESFPGLETARALEAHKATVLRFMDDGCAVCAVEAGTVAGALLFTRQDNALCFLAVDPAFRRRQLGRGLVGFAAARLGGNKPITVTTYRQGDPRGVAARAFYKSLGFSEGRLGEAFGCPVQEFVLNRQGPSAAAPCSAATTGPAR